MGRIPLELPAEFIRELDSPPPPTYAEHGSNECGNCLHMRRDRRGLPVPAGLDGKLGDTAKLPKAAVALIARFYAGLGHCMLSPPVPGRNRVSVFPTTHVSWACQFQTPVLDGELMAEALPKPG